MSSDVIIYVQRAIYLVSSLICDIFSDDLSIWYLDLSKAGIIVNAASPGVSTKLQPFQ